MYEEYVIEAIQIDSDSIRTFWLDTKANSERKERFGPSGQLEKLDAIPGQFVMVWLPGIDEKPFSVSHDYGFTVKKVGPVTEKLFELREGDILNIRGPYGSGFPKYLVAYEPGLTIVAGGIGIAPLRFLAEKAYRHTSGKTKILFGGKTADDIIFKDELEGFGELRVATEDGPLGHKGLVTNLIEPEDTVYAICGPGYRYFKS